jgi:hypothetical protein
LQSDGWIKLSGSSENTKGTFVLFDRDLNFMEGANFADKPMTDLIFAEIQAEGYNKIGLVNDNAENALISFDLVRADGFVQGTVTRQISAHGALVADLFGNLFSGLTPDATEYVRIHADRGIYAFDVMRQNSGDIAIIQAQDAAALNTTLYSAHYIVGDVYRTRLSVINLDAMAGTIRMRLIGNNGIMVGSERLVNIAAHGKILIEDPKFFVTLAAGNAVSGYIEIVSNGVRLAGSTVYGDLNRQTFYTALPLTVSMQGSMLFNHVISNETFSSQFVIVNPGSAGAQVNVALYSNTGTMVAEAQELVGARERYIGDLTEIFPSIVGQNYRGGYVLISSTTPIIPFMQFGNVTLSALSTILPQAVPYVGSSTNTTPRTQEEIVAEAQAIMDAFIRYFIPRH